MQKGFLVNIILQKLFSHKSIWFVLVIVLYGHGKIKQTKQFLSLTPEKEREHIFYITYACMW